jgi:hypothetical protein
MQQQPNNYFTLSNFKLLAVIVSLISSVGLIAGLLAIFKIVPIEYVWGGRASNYEQLVQLEIINFVINSLLIISVLIKTNIIKLHFPKKIINIVLILFFAIMLLNTFGNLVAVTYIEKFFSILTAISSYFLYLIIWKSDLRKN